MDNPDRWYFSKEQLANTPSRKCGVSEARELSFRQQAANFIQDMGQRLQVNQLCINTAIVYMHRFYVFHSFTDIHRNKLSLSALFLAAKVEEQPRKLEHLIKVAHACLHKDSPSLDVRSDAYIEKQLEVVVHENILLQTLGFTLGIDHPHTSVVKVCQLVKASKDLAQTSYIMASTSLHMTTMCLEYKPTVVACVCIHLACKWSDWRIEPCSEGKEWYFYVDRNVTAEILETLTNKFIETMESCPQRFRKNFGKEVNYQNPRSMIDEPSTSKGDKKNVLSPGNSLHDFAGFDDKTAVKSEKNPAESTSQQSSAKSSNPVQPSSTVQHSSHAKKHIKTEPQHSISLENYREKKEKERLQNKTSDSPIVQTQNIKKPHHAFHESEKMPHRTSKHPAEPVPGSSRDRNIAALHKDPSSLDHSTSHNKVNHHVNKVSDGSYHKNRSGYPHSKPHHLNDAVVKTEKVDVAYNDVNKHEKHVSKSDRHDFNKSEYYKQERAAKERALLGRKDRFDPIAKHEKEKIEAARQERDRVEAARQERERVEAARLERDRLEKERIETARLEKERYEAAKLERERLEAARIEKERLEAARLERERLEAVRLEKERLEAARLERERLEAVRVERERIEAAKLERERLEAERLERERIEAERLERERIEAERLERIEAERREKERIEAERRERERIEAERRERERVEAERRERERIEAERRERERIEAERRERERIEAERLEKERIEAERREREILEAQRLEKERIEAARVERERYESALEAARLERERVETAKRQQERIDSIRLGTLNKIPHIKAPVPEQNEYKQERTDQGRQHKSHNKNEHKNMVNHKADGVAADVVKKERREKHKKHSSKDKMERHNANHLESVPSTGIKVKIPKTVINLSGIVPESSQKYQAPSRPESPKRSLKIKLPKPPDNSKITKPSPTSIKLVITKDKSGSGSYSTSHKNDHERESRKRVHSNSNSESSKTVPPSKHQKLDHSQRSHHSSASGKSSKSSRHSSHRSGNEHSMNEQPHPANGNNAQSYMCNFPPPPQPPKMMKYNNLPAGKTNANPPLPPPLPPQPPPPPE